MALMLLPPALPVLEKDCNSCALSVVYKDADGAELLVCTAFGVGDPASPVQKWRYLVADLDLRGWPVKQAATACPSFVDAAAGA